MQYVAFRAQIGSKKERFCFLVGNFSSALRKLKSKLLDFKKSLCYIIVMDMDLPKEVIETYLQRRMGDVDTLQKSLSENSVKEFNRIGHQLVGNATSFGFDELVPIASQMEDLTTDKLPSEGSELIQQFKNWLQSARNRIGPLS